MCRCDSHSRESESSSESESEESDELEDYQYTLLSQRKQDLFQKICHDPWEVYWRDSGKCERLAVPPQYSGVCGADRWLILGSDNNPYCAKFPCDINELPYVDGHCHSDSSLVCPPGMMFYVTLFGEAFCDCKPGHYFWPHDSKCYKLYQRGPCDINHQFIYSINQTQCMYNPCHSENQIFITETAECHMLNTRGPCQKDYVLIRGDDTHRDGGTVQCVHQSQTIETATVRSVGGSIIVAPLLRCWQGYRLSYTRECSLIYTPRLTKKWFGLNLDIKF